MALIEGNLLTENQQSIETDIDNWAGFLTSSSSTVRSTTQAHDGTASIRATYNGTPSDTMASLTSSVPTVIAGVTYTFSYWVYSPRAVSYQMLVEWYNAANTTYISDAGKVGLTSVPANTWTKISVTQTAAAGAGAARLYIMCSTGLTTGDFVYFDEIFFGIPEVSPESFTVPGTYTWTAPAGVTSVQCECWGGGGAGGGTNTTANTAGGGGAGGAYAKTTSIAVTPGTNYTVTVGAGGVHNTPSSNNTAPAGGDSWFINNTTILAKGGAGGQNRTTAGNGTAGSGTTTGSIGSTLFAGGNASAGASATAGGGGGGGAGDSGAGGNATGATAGTGGTSGGGNGGAGATNGAGSTASAPGGGGGGARNSASTARNGGDGGAGKVILTWSAGPTSVSDSDTSSSADSESIAATLNDADTSAGTESQSIAATLSDSDTGAGTETATIGVSDTDTSAGGETQSIAATNSDADTGAGSETATIGVSDADTASGAESEGIVQGATDPNEGSSGGESQSIVATFSDLESGAGGETWSLSVSLSSSDTVTGTESETAGGGTTPTASEGSSAGESESIQIFWDPIQEKSLVQGPATLYIAPFGAVEPALSAVSSAPDSAVWTDLGGTLGGVDLSIEQEWIQVDLKQLPDQPMRRLKRRRMSIKTQLAEATLANLGYALNDTTSGSAGTGWSSFSPQNRSEASVLSYSALIVDGWAPGFQLNHKHKRRRLIVRKCLSIDNVEFGYTKDGQTVYTVTWSCHYVDSTTPPFRIVDGL